VKKNFKNVCKRLVKTLNFLLAVAYSKEMVWWASMIKEL